MKSTVEESTKYESLIGVKDDTYGSASLREFLELTESIEEDLQKSLNLKNKNKQKENFYYKKMFISFRNDLDYIEFQKLIGQKIVNGTKEYLYESGNYLSQLLGEESNFVSVKPKSQSSSKKSNLHEFLDEEEVDDDKEWKNHWIGMPEYDQANNPPYEKILFLFKTEDDYKDLSVRIKQELSEKTISIWHPKLNKDENASKRWVEINEVTTNPVNPVYIVSKGRADSMITSRSLSRMKVPHYIVIEPQDEESYENALDNFGIRDYVTLLIAPFSNHGDGPGRARNWAWDHAISIGAEKHWVMDDNISDFYRLQQNQRIRVESGVMFKICEDFVDRYENIPISGIQYRFFIAPNSYYPPYVKNTRIYSCLLISNDCKHRWRGRYNEDTDICLRVLKDGDCTVQFNAFLQGKCATQTVKGGNTAEFYHAEGETDKTKWRDGHMNATGTINKSKMLEDLHPDVARVEWRYDRWHHYVDYGPFKKNQLRLKEGIYIDEKVDNYGLTLVTNFKSQGEL